MVVFNNAWTLGVHKPGTHNGENYNVNVSQGNPSFTGADITINDITINAGSTVTLDAESKVEITGTLTNNGSITINSTHNSFGNLIVSTITGTGTVSYKRYVAPTPANDLIAAPLVDNTQTFAQFFAVNSNIRNNGSSALFAPYSNANTAYESLFSTTASTKLQVGKGYKVGRTAGSTPETLTFTGTVQTNDVNVAVEANNGNPWNLIGNPYTSAINLQEFLTHNAANFDNGNAVIYGYKGTQTNSWEAYNSTSGNVLIAPGQGFFVPTVTGNISFTKTMRSAATAQDFNTVSGREAQTASWFNLQLTAADKAYSTKLYFDNHLTNGLDQGYDAPVFTALSNVETGIYSSMVAGAQALAIQALALDQLETAVPLGVKVAAGAQAKIALTDVNYNGAVYLEDTFNNQWVDLTKQDYTYSSTNDNVEEGRFLIHLSNEALNLANQNTQNLNAIQQGEHLIVTGDLSQINTIALFDVQGRKISAHLVNHSSQLSIATSTLNAGVYILQYNGSFGSKTQKIILK